MEAISAAMAFGQMLLKSMLAQDMVLMSTSLSSGASNDMVLAASATLRCAPLHCAFPCFAAPCDTMFAHKGRNSARKSDSDFHIQCA